MEDNSKFYTLPETILPALHLSAHLADLMEIQTFLKVRGHSTQNTRIDRYIEYLGKSESASAKSEQSIFKNSSDSRFKSSTDWHLYVLREIHELMWILRGLKCHIPSGLDTKLDHLIGGSDFAALDTSPHCRNIQFELRIASYFCQVGWAVDLTTETDIIAVHDKCAVFIECKRVASTDQLQKRLSEAAKQLKARMPRKYKNKIVFGVVAADVTKIAFPHNGLTWALTPEHSKDINRKKLRDLVDPLFDKPNSFGGRNIIRYWFQLHIPCIIRNPPLTATRFSNYSVENIHAGKKAISTLKLLRGLDAAPLIPDPRELPPIKLLPRTEMQLPAGTTFRPVDQEILRELVQTGRVMGRQDDDVIAKLEFGGINHEFSLFDLQMTFASVANEKFKDLAKSDIKSGLELLLVMFIHKYPYENVGSSL